MASLALSAAPAPAPAADRESAGEAEIQAALERDLHLTADQVRDQRALQALAIKRDRTLRTALGEAYAGSVYDADSGKLVAMVSDATQIPRPEPSGPRSSWSSTAGPRSTVRGFCSAGFNLRNQFTGTGFLLTAGHCVRAGERITGHGGFLGSGVDFGPVLESWFPTFDDALIRNDYPQWIQGPWVDVTPSNGRSVPVTGFTDGRVGTFVCKSGITTIWTCGTITRKDETSCSTA